MGVLIKSNLKPILDERKISMRQLSNLIMLLQLSESCIETKRYPRDLLDKVCTYLNIELHELLIFEKDSNRIDHTK
ncbi:helix-turn-helix domain-containing protein [Bacillus atrophaeus]|uniref:helix-turn-helix domain-containing protein n=1 Tax=Bacillus atrophaeus TaxID=1452 RepID=UPI002D8044D1|nr:helix-turn-helix domain-containing protein [Bacillus atrophaeus]